MPVTGRLSKRDRTVKLDRESKESSTKWPCDVRAWPEKTFVSIMGGKVSVPR